MGKGNNILLKVLGVLLMAALAIVAVFGFKKPENQLQTAKATEQTYEILEPNSWLGKPLPFIDYIDIGDKIKTGNWLVLFYHYDCPDCITAIEELNKTKYETQDARYYVAIIEVPPYGKQIETNCLHGQLLETKEWFITTPAIILLKNGKVAQTW